MSPSSQPSGSSTSSTNGSKSGTQIGSSISKTFIFPRGKEFDKQKECAGKISSIIKSRYNGAHRSWKKVSREARDLWFREFGNSYCWVPEKEHEIHMVFEHRGSEQLKNLMAKVRKKKKKPHWIGEPHWIGKSHWFDLEKLWDDKDYKKMCKTNQKIHESDCNGQGKPIQFGGRITYLTHRDRMAKDFVEDPSVA